MTISEQSRHAMFVRLESALGEEAALILMEHLPPVGWADVATKRDLDQHLEHLHVLMQRDLAIGMAELRSEISAQTRTIVLAVITAVVAVSGLTLTATQLG